MTASITSMILFSSEVVTPVKRDSEISGILPRTN